MVIREVRAAFWRNLEPLVLRPGPGLTVLFGRNGQGKTNILEAIYFLATLRSFRTSHARELVRSGEAPGGAGAARGDGRRAAAWSAAWRSRSATARAS